MAINKVIYGNTTLMDLTSDTIASDKIIGESKQAYDATGELVSGGNLGATVYVTHSRARLVIPETFARVVGTTLIVDEA